MLQEGRVKNKYVRFLAVGGTRSNYVNPNPTGDNGWLSKKAWLAIE